jgi:hypothetical protein
MVSMRQKKAYCPVCGNVISRGTAYISFGAVIDYDILDKYKLSDSILEGFCHIGYHGSDPDMIDSASCTIADNILGGQADIEFCSLKCLRKWFCKIVDNLKQEIAWQLQHNRLTPAREKSNAKALRSIMKNVHNSKEKADRNQKNDTAGS